MTKYVLTVLVAGLLLGAAPAPKEDDAKKDTEKLQGTWQVTSVEERGRSRLQREAITVFIDKETMTVTIGGEMDFKGTFKLDPSKKPKTIDVTIAESRRDKEKGKVLHGIYEVDKDTLKWCMAEPDGTDRPKEFSTKEGINHMLVKLKKDKP
jgi:uncharacterized protein (TIGR03067 family)